MEGIYGITYIGCRAWIGYGHSANPDHAAMSMGTFFRAEDGILRLKIKPDFWLETYPTNKKATDALKNCADKLTEPDRECPCDDINRPRYFPDFTCKYLLGGKP